MTTIGIIGGGSIGARHVRAFRDAGAQVTHVVSRTREGAGAFAAAHGLVAADTLDALLAAVDCVVIASPTDVHRAQALAAIAARRPVLCEKPLARTAADAAFIAQAAHEAGVPLIPLHVVRWFDAYAEARAQARDGAFGTLHTLSLERHGTRPSAPGGSWFENDARSGGVIFDLLIHDIDYALWVCGPVRAVRAAQAQPLHAEISLQHASGAITHITGTWDAPRFRTAASLFGETGMRDFDDAQATIRDPYAAQAADALRAVTSGAPIRVSARDGVRAVAVAEAALQSVAGGSICTPKDFD